MTVGTSKKFGKAVAARRRELGWTAQRLAEVCSQEQHVPLTRSIVAKIESGHRSYVTLEEFLGLSATLGIDRNEYVSLEGRRRPTTPVRRPWYATMSTKDPLTVEHLERIIGRVAAIYRLSRRERDIVELLLRGRSDQGIAESLGVRGPTAYRYTQAMLQKMAISTRYEIIPIILREIYPSDARDKAEVESVTASSID